MSEEELTRRDLLFKGKDVVKKITAATVAGKLLEACASTPVPHHESRAHREAWTAEDSKKAAKQFVAEQEVWIMDWRSRSGGDAPVVNVKIESTTNDQSVDLQKILRVFEQELLNNLNHRVRVISYSDHGGADVTFSLVLSNSGSEHLRKYALTLEAIKKETGEILASSGYTASK